MRPEPMKNQHDFVYDRSMVGDRFPSVRRVRRARRQLNRAWAVAGRIAYGKNSIKAYCEYIEEYGYLTGE